VRYFRFRAFPKEETFSLTDQIRRSSRSIGANIAEAWAKRRYERHFVCKLTDADGEQMETQHWIGTALDCGYLRSRKPMQRADSFWDDSKTLRESTPEYFTNHTNPLSN
jgi:four helix bundle protein